MRHVQTLVQSFPARILFFVALPLLLTVMTASVLVLHTLERQFERRMHGDVEMVARALQKPVSHALERQRQGSLRKALESAVDIGRVYGVSLYNRRGALVASLGSAESRDQPDAAARLRDQPRGGGHYGFIGGEPVYSYYVPVRLGRDFGTGLLRISRRKAEIDAFMSKLWTGGLTFVLVLGSIMIFTVVFGYQRAAGSAFEHLRAAMARIRGGNRAYRATIEKPYELRMVS